MLASRCSTVLHPLSMGTKDQKAKPSQAGEVEDSQDRVFFVKHSALASMEAGCAAGAAGGQTASFLQYILWVRGLK